jgi:hypothetical protein
MKNEERHRFEGITLEVKAYWKQAILGSLRKTAGNFEVLARIRLNY